jgi:uncharacterized protein (DUF2141 family)
MNLKKLWLVKMKQNFKHIAIFVVLIIITSFTKLYPQEGTITVDVNGLKNNDGNLCVALFINDIGFPANHQKALVKKIIPIKSKKMTFTLRNIKYGVYALSILHDDNKNNKMDFHILGFPKEGYGVSNNIRSPIGPPKFDECTFKLNSDEIHLQININYFGKK